MKREHYCFWTVASGERASSAVAMIASARRAGVFKDFHVWTDAAIPDAECHAPGRFDPRDGLFRFTYLRDAVSALKYDHYVWLDPQTEFTRDPGSVLRVLRRAPVHVPLTFDLADAARTDEEWCGVRCGELARRMREVGVAQRFVFAAHAGFFIVHREAVETFCNLAFDFWHRCERDGLHLPCEPLLAYAAQMLSGDPRLHHFSHGADVWMPRTGIQRAAAPALLC